MPKAFLVSLTPGAACRRLYSASSSSFSTRLTSARSKRPCPRSTISATDSSSSTSPVEHLVEDRIGRQRVLVGLVGPQFGARRLVDDRLRDHVAMRAERAVGHVRIAPVGELVDLHLEEVLDRIEAAVHVAIDGGVADRHLGLVAGGQQHRAESCWRPPSAPARACATGCSPRSMSGGALPNTGCSSLQRLVDRRADRRRCRSGRRAARRIPWHRAGCPRWCSDRAASGSGRSRARARRRRWPRRWRCRCRPRGRARPC